MSHDLAMQFFGYAHLPAHLQEVSKPYADLAATIIKLPGNPQRTIALQKLLESKDCAVRAVLAGEAPARAGVSDGFPVTVNGSTFVFALRSFTASEIKSAAGINQAETLVRVMCDGTMEEVKNNYEVFTINPGDTFVSHVPAAAGG